MAHDWPRMISDLRASGLTDYKIAHIVGYEHPKEIQAIAEGRIPRHDIGELLISLHAMVCPNGHVSATQTEKSGVCSDAADAGTGECSFLPRT